MDPKPTVSGFGCGGVHDPWTEVSGNPRTTLKQTLDM